MSESNDGVIEDLTNAYSRLWPVIAPSLKRKGIDTEDPQGLKEKIASLEKQLFRANMQIQQAASRISPDLSRDSSREALGKYQSLFHRMGVVDCDGFETLISDALSWEQDLAGEELFQFGNIEEIRGLSRSVHSNALQLAMMIASGWYGESRLLKLADINHLTSLVDETTPTMVYAFMTALFCRIVKDVPDQLSLEEQITASQALILLRLVQFLVHHIRRMPSATTIWAGFQTLESHLKDAVQHTLVGALFRTLNMLSIRQNTTLVDELRKTSPKFTTGTHDFVLDGSNLFILGIDGSIAFVPSAEYRIELALIKRQWIVSVASEVLGGLSFVLCDAPLPGVIRSITQVFKQQLKAQNSTQKLDPNEERDICW